MPPADDADLPIPSAERRSERPPAGGRRRLADDTDAPDTPARRPAGHAYPTTASGERRRLAAPDGAGATGTRGLGRTGLEPTDDQDLPPTSSHRQRTAEPIGRRRLADDQVLDAPAATATSPRRGGPEDRALRERRRPTDGPRRRRLDPEDDPDFPAGASTWITDDPDAPPARRRDLDPPKRPADPRARNGRAHPSDTGTPELPDGGHTRRRHLVSPDDPDLPAISRRGAAEPADTTATATTALPRNDGTHRRHLPTDDVAEPIGLPANGRGRAPDSADPRRTDPRPADPRRADPRPADPRRADPRRHRADVIDDEPPHSSSTTALPAAGRRRPREEPDTSDAQATTALPTTHGTRRPDPSAPPATTALPAAGSRRRRPEPAEPTGTRGRRDAMRPEATAVVPAAGETSDSGEDADAPAATTRVRSISSDGDAPVRSRSSERTDREMRIDETLTRMTAAHAGLTLAVTDRPAQKEISVPRRGVAVTAGRLLAAALALVVLGATAFGWGTKTWLGSAVRDAAALDPGSSAVVDAAAQAGDENVLVVAAEPAAEEGQPRADSVAVAHIPDGGGPVTVLAFPLDLEINRPPCERWDAGAMTYSNEPVQAETRTQLVSALDLGGPRCITRVVQLLSGLAITRYVGIDLGALPAMTDAVGGAEVCVPRPVLDGVLGPVVPDAGPNRLAGVRAADFVQAGDVEGDPSAEYGRIERQQQVLAAVLDSAVSGTALLDVGRLAALRPALSDAVLTDGAGIDQMLALSMTLRRLDTDGVQFAEVPTGERTGRGNAVLRDTDAAALFAAVRADEPLPPEATELGPSGSSGPTPSEVTVEVVNASSRSGLAGDVSETLSSLGFNVDEPSSADQPTSETVIRFSPDQAAAAEVLAATVPSATSVPDPGSTGVLELVLGQSFDDVVRAPAEPIALTAPTAEPTAEPAVTCA